MKTDILKSGSTVKNHISLKTGFGSRLVNEFFLQFSSFNLNDTFKTGESSSFIFLKLVFFTNYDSIKRQWDSRKRGWKWNWFPSSARVKFKCWRDDRTGRPVVCCRTWQVLPSQPKNLKSNKEETTIERGDPLFADSVRAPLSFEIPEWLQEFREIWVDDRVLEYRDSHASSSHGQSLEPTRSADLGNHSVQCLSVLPWLWAQHLSSFAFWCSGEGGCLSRRAWRLGLISLVRESSEWMRDDAFSEVLVGRVFVILGVKFAERLLTGMQRPATTAVIVDSTVLRTPREEWNICGNSLPCWAA